MCSVSVCVTVLCQWPLTLKEWLPTGVFCCRKELWAGLLVVPKWTVRLRKEAGLESTPEASCYLGGVYLPGGAEGPAQSSGWAGHCFLPCACLYPEEPEGRLKR